MDEEDWDNELASSSTTTAATATKNATTFNSSGSATHSQQQQQHGGYGYGYGGNNSGSGGGFSGDSFAKYRSSHDSSNASPSSYGASKGGPSSRFGEGGGSGGGERLRDRSQSMGGRDRSRDQSQRYGGSGSGGGGNELSETLSVDVRHISSIIGKAGATINNIRDTCGVRINVPGREELAGRQSAELRISGSSHQQIYKARDMINEITQSASSGGGGSSSFGNRGSSGFGSGGGGGGGATKRYHDENYGGGGGSGGGFGGSDRNNNSHFSRNSSDYPSSQRNSSSVRESSTEKRQRADFEASAASFQEPPAKPSSSGGGGGGFGIDWDAVRTQPLQNLGKFKDHPAVVKDFYVEDAEIAAMSRDEVKQYRKENFNIMVELFKKEKLSYTIKANDENEDKRTPEQIDDYLFEHIPKPIKRIDQAFRGFPEILDECRRQNFEKPTPIQAQMWPILLKGLDCVGIAQTGTGKTLAFLLPALIHIDNQTTPREKRVGPNVVMRPLLLC